MSGRSPYDWQRLAKVLENMRREGALTLLSSSQGVEVLFTLPSIMLPGPLAYSTAWHNWGYPNLFLFSYSCNQNSLGPVLCFVQISVVNYLSAHSHSLIRTIFSHSLVGQMLASRVFICLHASGLFIWALLLLFSI